MRRSLPAPRFTATATGGRKMASRIKISLFTVSKLRFLLQLEDLLGGRIANPAGCKEAVEVEAFGVRIIRIR